MTTKSAPDLSSCVNRWPFEQDVDFQFIEDHFVGIDADFFIDKLVKNETFTYVLYGDLEWTLMLYKRGNIEHSMMNNLNNRLKNVLINNPPYHVAFSEKLFKVNHIHDFAKQLIIENNIQKKFVDNDIFNDMFRYQSNKYMYFLDALNNTNMSGKNPNFDIDIKKIVHIGNEHINNLVPNVFVPIERVIISKRNCFKDYSTTKARLVEIADRYNDEKLLFFFSASAMSPILIDDLYSIYGDKHWFIDIGSQLDFFLGYASRTPAKCFKELLYNTYELCMSVEFEEIVEESMSLN